MELLHLIAEAGRRASFVRVSDGQRASAADVASARRAAEFLFSDGPTAVDVLAA